MTKFATFLWNQDGIAYSNLVNADFSLLDSCVFLEMSLLFFATLRSTTFPRIQSFLG